MRKLRNVHQPRVAAQGLVLVAVVLGSGCAREGRTREPALEVVTEPAPPLRQGGSEARGEPLDVEVAKKAATEAARAAGGGDEMAAEQAPARPKSVTDIALELEASSVLDDWHAAASVGDRDRYVGHFAPDAVFLGTDETERWDLATFTAYVDEHFRPGKGWSYTPFNRYVLLSPSRDLAWFDEQLDSAGYGALRGTGVLRREEDSWKIVHYSMTFTIPNGVAKQVVGVVREASR